MTGVKTTLLSKSAIHKDFARNDETQLREGVILRLHFVRHAETEANYANIVLGQIDSPLTKLGIQQAKCAGIALRGHSFWKKYSSDLYRAEKTARLILDDDDNTEDNTDSKDYQWNKSGLILDARLRERAKGVREGRDESLSYDEALKLYHQEKDFTSEMPLLETEQDVWNRINDWIGDLVTDVCRDDDKNENNMDEIGNVATFQIHHQPQRVYDVLAVSHSGTLRIIIEKIAGENLPSEAKRGPAANNKDGEKLGRLLVPNTSVTVIDVFSPIKTCLDPSTASIPKSRVHDLKWDTKLVELTRTSHLKIAHSA